MNKIIAFLILILLINKLHSSEIPTIVIAPSKKPQSISTVGTSVTVIDEKDLENSNEFFIGDVLSYSSPSTNYYSSGGYGTFSAIQLRGLPKRYSTIYIDGVKMSDPSAISNDYYIDDILKNQVERIEILRGNQSSIYGSGAMGGTINIVTKKGKPGFHKEVKYNTASHGTHNLSASFSGADEKNNFWIGIEKFMTDGISAMSDNDEEDGYKNNTLVANYSRKLTDKFKLDSKFRFNYNHLKFDTADSSFCTNCNDDNSSRSKEANGLLNFVYETSPKFSNQLKLVKTHNRRAYDEYSKWGTGRAEDYYRGLREAIYYSGTYNYNLDNSITFGYEKEFDEMDWEKSGKDYNRSEQINSKYFDIQSRVFENFYVTAGARFDDHSKAGSEDSHRLSAAYLLDNNTKFKSSYGTSFRYPSLYEIYVAWDDENKKKVAETGKSFDLGIEKIFSDFGLQLDLTWFTHEYHDTLDGWKDSPSDSAGYHNQPGLVQSDGIEFITKWKKNDNLNFNLNYTYTSTYDGADMDDALDADGNSGGTGGGAFLDSRMVRIPRHNINLSTYYKLPNSNLSFNLHSIWSDDMRDYGNFNSPKHGTDYADVKLDDYFVNHLSINYDLFGYDTFFKINNIFDEKYNTALDYSQMDRTFNFGIKRVY